MPDKKQSLAALARAAVDDEAKDALRFWLSTVFGTEPLEEPKTETIRVVGVAADEFNRLYERVEEVEVSGIGTYRPVTGMPRGARHSHDGLTFVALRDESDGAYYAHLEGTCGSKGCEPVHERFRSLADVGRILSTERACHACGKPIVFEKRG